MSKRGKGKPATGARETPTGEHNATGPRCIRPTANGVKIQVHAKPGARESAVTGMGDSELDVRIGAPPREGAANKELVAFMAQILGVKERDVSLQVGTKSRTKVLLVQGVTQSQALERLQSASGGVRGDEKSP